MREGSRQEGNVLGLFTRYTYIAPNILTNVKEKGVTIWNKYHNYREMRNFHTIIISPLASEVISNDSSIIEREVLRLLEDGGHVCLLCGSKSIEDKVITDILYTASISLIPLLQPILEVNVKQSEFTSYLRNHSIVSNLIKSDTDVDSVICTTRYVVQDENVQRETTKSKNEAVVAFTIRKGLNKAMLRHLNQAIWN